MKADPFVQLRLLDLQALDTTLDQLAHRRATLPEIAELAGLDTRLAALRDGIVLVSTEDHDLGREQSKIETDVELVADPGQARPAAARLRRDRRRPRSSRTSSTRSPHSAAARATSRTRCSR